MPDEPAAQPLPDELTRELEAIFDLTVVGLAHLRNRVIVHCNRRMEELFGFGPGELLGQSTRVWYRSEEEFRVIGGSAYPDLAQGRIHSREQYFQRRDGSEFWGRIAGRALDPACPTDCVLLIEDASARRLADERLHDALYEQQLMFDNAAVGILFLRGRVIQRCNPRFEEIFGYLPGELLGQTTARLYPDDERYRRFGVDAYALVRDGVVYSADIEVTRKDGSLFWVQATGRRIETVDGDLSSIWIVEDVTERHHAQEALAEYRERLEIRVAERTAELESANQRLQAEILERLDAQGRIWQVANHDALTSLPNRSLFRDRLTQALAQAERRGNHAALIFVDLDRFKSVNDGLGHEVGDLLLQEAAIRLSTVLRAVDTVARLGGDEFVVLLPEVDGPAYAESVSEKLRLSLTPRMTLQGHVVHVTASMGIAIYPEHGRNGAELMRNADTAMYRAKADGRNVAWFFSPEMKQAASRFFHIESRLPGALEKGEFMLHYQPLVEIASRRVIGLEALIRWNSDGATISPAEFIPVAEESGFILPLGEWVLREACRQAVRWQRQGLAPVTIAVNLSPRQFRQPGLLEQVRTILEETGLAPIWLELEITETTLMSQADETLAKLRELSGMGIKLAVDDFGTGYSSLNYLKRFPVDKLKIDQSFVRDLCSDRDDAAIVSAIIDLCRNLGLVSLAEGVETGQQLEALERAGCALCQGYFFSVPLPANEVARFLGSSIR